MSSHLPTELWEIIFDGLLGQIRTLKACSLVCRSWKSLAWKRLFHTLYLRYPTWDQQMAPPKTSSWQSMWARSRKCLSDNASEVDEGWAPLLLFFNSPLQPTQYTVRIKMGLYLNESAVAPSFDFFEADSSRFPSLREIHVLSNNLISQVTLLELARINFRSFNDLMTLLASSRCTELIISDSTWKSQPDVQLSHQLHPPPIHTLSLARIETWAISTLCDWLHHFDCLRDIRTLKLQGRTPEHRQGDDVLLQRCTSVQFLYVCIGDTYTCASVSSRDYSSCFALREITLTESCWENPCAEILRMIQKLARPERLERIKLELISLDLVDLSGNDRESHELDDYLFNLSRRAFKSLVLHTSRHVQPVSMDSESMVSQFMFPKLYFAGRLDTRKAEPTTLRGRGYKLGFRKADAFYVQGSSIARIDLKG
ncbi:SubName: Full=Uncharacterized protein {ECO:0000313/EMBL:CCA75800.1} [Serendipita indica DSM 11827]|nr:SubName: Full=Uncharacterized protein {ECO:0000313/EMBL:CCA75800.1} [Serendipita indica DSM 11827]